MLQANRTGKGERQPCPGSSSGRGHSEGGVFHAVTQRNREGASVGTHPAGRCFQEISQQVPSQKLQCEFPDQQNG